jgi:hypothetical protein
VVVIVFAGTALPTLELQKTMWLEQAVQLAFRVQLVLPAETAEVGK